MFLTPAEAAAIEAQVARIEARFGVQLATAVVGKSDTYVELPWKAFACGASMAALGVVAADAVRPDWVTTRTALVHAVAILSAGAASALLAALVPAFGRLFLRDARREVEVREYARSLFLTRELFNTPQRTAVLILVSLFERRIEVLPDVGLHDFVSRADWQTVVARMTPPMRRARPFEALTEGLAACDALLAASGFRGAVPSDVNSRLPDLPIEERGA